MAEKRKTRARREDDERYDDYDDRFDDHYDNDDDYEDDEEPRRSTSRQLSAAAAARAGLREIAELTGKETTGITSVQRSEDGWSVGVEVVEDHRVPSTADILGEYEAVIDMSGELVSYQRTRRYSRGRGVDGGS